MGMGSESADSAGIGSLEQLPIIGIAANRSGMNLDIVFIGIPSFIKAIVILDLTIIGFSGRRCSQNREIEIELDGICPGLLISHFLFMHSVAKIIHFIPKYT
jgi:hypothetical protein